MSWGNAIGWSVVHAVWQGVLVSGAYLVARRHLRGGGPAVHHVLAWSALLTSAALFSFTLWAYGRGLHLEWVAAEAPRATSTGAPAPLGIRLTDDVSGIGYVWAAVAAALVLRLVVASSVLLPRLRRYARVVSPAWARRSRGLCRAFGLSGDEVQVLESPHVDSPLACGVRRPVIVMPSQALRTLPGPLVESLLAHEIAHVRRRDYLANLLQSCLEAMLSLQPTTWWLGLQIRTAREHCCDDLAAATCGDARLYAQALYALESSRRDAPALAMTATHGSLVRRVERLVRPQARARTTPAEVLVAAATLLSAAAVAALLVLPAAASGRAGGGTAGTSVVQHAGAVATVPSAYGGTERLERIEFEHDVPPAVQQQVLASLSMEAGAALHGEARHRIARVLQHTRRGMTFTDRPGTRAGTLRIIVSLDC